eukprot:scaffold221978_cov33-Tisochrysis_lutea.AAC.2
MGSWATFCGCCIHLLQVIAHRAAGTRDGHSSSRTLTAHTPRMSLCRLCLYNLQPPVSSIAVGYKRKARHSSSPAQAPR